MNDLSQFDESVWDRFFDFVEPAESAMTHAEVQEELQRLGIDVTRAVSKVRNALEAVNARSLLQEARTKRAKLTARLNEIVAPVESTFRKRVQQLIRKKFEGTLQAAYFRKLESAASDADLQSLLEDMYRLELFSDESEEIEGPDAP